MTPTMQAVAKAIKEARETVGCSSHDTPIWEAALDTAAFNLWEELYGPNHACAVLRPNFLRACGCPTPSTPADPVSR